MDTKNSFEYQVRSLAAAAMASPKQGGGFIKVQIMLRVLAILLASAAMVTMLTSRESVNFFGILMEARYTYSSAFKFLMAADAVVFAFSLLSLIFVFLLSRSKPNPCSYFTVFLHDLVVVLLMMAGCGAATAIGVVGRDGMAQVGWLAMCGNVSKFCHKMTFSVALSYLVMICYIVLTVTSVYKLKYLAAGMSNPESQEGVSGEK